MCNKFYKKSYVLHINPLKMTLDYRRILERVQSVMEFNQGAWLKTYIDMNKELGKKDKYDFEK